MHARVTLLVVLIALVAAGCGGSSPKAAGHPGTYRDRVSSCLGQVSLTTSAAGNAMRVTGSDGAAIANIQIFATGAQAQHAYDQLAVSGTHGGRALAVFFAGANDASMRRVVEDCLTP